MINMSLLSVPFCLILALSVFFVNASCPSSNIGNDVYQDLMDVMIKVKCHYKKIETKEKPAFFATLKSTLNLSSGTVIKFDGVRTNIMNAYNAGSGVFTAPVAGVYEFASNFISNGDNWLEVNLMKNNEIIVKGHSAKANGTGGSLQAILKLRKGDKIYIRHPRSSGSMNGGHFSMFSGYLL